MIELVMWIIHNLIGIGLPYSIVRSFSYHGTIIVLYKITCNQLSKRLFHLNYFIMHLMGMLGLSGIMAKVASFGGAGAHVYIFCSGFGLYLSHLNKPLTYRPFLCRRFSRTYLPIAVLVNAIWMAYNGLD